VGERDVPDFQRVSKTIAERSPQARLAVLPGVGHMSNMEAPQQFNELVLNFLSAVR
jgi:pimeloyl-ACP methyl ester carboxylesterase